MKPIQRIAGGLFALLIAPLAGAAPSVWQGHIGTLPIVLEQQVDQGGKPECSGRYFYPRHRLDITLDGDINAEGGCVFSEFRPRAGADERTVLWRMRPAEGATWRGEWIGLDGKRLPVALTRVDANALPQARDASLNSVRDAFDPYVWLRLSALKLQPGKRQTFQGRQLQWQREPVSGIELFNVSAGYPPNELARINHALTRRHWEWVNASFECQSGVPAGEQGFDGTTVTPRLMSDRLFSVSLFTSYYCGGAHPDFGDAPLNLDIASGRELRLEDVLWVGKGQPVFNRGTGETDWSRAWGDYRDKTFAPWVIAQFSAIYPAQMAVPSVPDEGCNYHDPDTWKFPTWYATARGIHLLPSTYRAARFCENSDWAILPWSVVRRYPGAFKF
ncbi:MAG: hypothetical protein Q4G62_02450 [Pseudomonadota bacterium]|nr:hypothetical protein [Pseudomonadota bacterium]